MIQIKYMLNDLVDQAYSNSPKLISYKKFYVDIIDKVMKSKHGDYDPRTHKIRVFNMYRDDSAIIVTTIHELAHHIDFINRGDSAHDDIFYHVYKTLLYSALDMSLFTKTDFLAATRDASDSNKVKNIIRGYKPKNVDYKNNLSKIICHNAYFEKNTLKEYGFSYNKINKTWEKEVRDEDLSLYQSMLDKLSTLNYEIVEATSYTFNY